MTGAPVTPRSSPSVLGGRQRDAASTSAVLLATAGERFARDGYRSTTVRQIGADAGVNAALINRYFGSKIGLFEACLAEAVTGLTQRVLRGSDRDGIVAFLRSVALDTTGARHRDLTLLLRVTGDTGADRARVAGIRSLILTIARRIEDSGDGLVADADLRAQIATAAVLGVMWLRSRGKLEPISSSPVSVLTGYVDEMLRSIVAGPDGTV